MHVARTFLPLSRSLKSDYLAYLGGDYFTKERKYFQVEKT